MKRNIHMLRKLLRRARYVEALRMCEELLAINPRDIEVRIEKSRVRSYPYPALFDEQEAIGVLTEALEWEPGNAELHEALGDAYDSASGDFGLAAEEYRNAIALDPQRASPYSKIGRLRYPGSGVTSEQALAYLLKAWELDKGNCEIPRDLGVLYWQLGRLQEGRETFEKSLRCVPPPDPYTKKQIQGWIRNINDGLN